MAKKYFVFFAISLSFISCGGALTTEDTRYFEYINGSGKITDDIYVQIHTVTDSVNEDGLKILIKTTDCSYKADKSEYNKKILIHSAYMINESDEKVFLHNREKSPISLKMEEDECRKKCCTDKDAQGKPLCVTEYNAWYRFETPVPFEKGKKIVLVFDISLMPEGIHRTISQTFIGKGKKIHHYTIGRGCFFTL
jgi:hypothetical protein